MKRLTLPPFSFSLLISSTQPPAKRSRRNAEAGPSRTTRQGARGRQASPIDVDEEPPVTKSRKKKPLPPSSEEEEEEEEVDETDPFVSEPPPSSQRRAIKVEKKPVPRPIVKSKGRETTKPVPAASRLVPPSTAELLEADLRVDPDTCDLSSKALEVYEGLLPKSVFITSPEAAGTLTTRASSTSVVSPLLFLPFLRELSPSFLSHSRPHSLATSAVA